MMWPPQSVKMHSTPAALSARAARIPPWTGDMRSTSFLGGRRRRRYHRPFERVKSQKHETGGARSRTPRPCDSGIRSPLEDLVADELGAAVVAPGGLVVTLHGRARLAEAHR